jgi:cell fate (sporulation/competence/biofilm development) regulator YlbF (YheA/YmcA/DUF963 family)
MKNKVFMGMAALMMVAFLSGCGKAPQAEIDAMNAAIEAAKAAEAPVYLPAEFAAVQDSMNVVMADIEAQSSKLFKNFGDAKAKLEETKTAAAKVAADAVVKKEAVKKEVETLLAEIKTVIEENATLITKAPRGKDGAAVIAQIKADIATIDTTVAEAQGLFDKGAYMEALGKVNAAKERAAGINTELKDAIAKARR